MHGIFLEAPIGGETGCASEQVLEHSMRSGDLPCSDEHCPQLGGQGQGF